MNRRTELDAVDQAATDDRHRAATAELHALMDAERPALIAALTGRSVVSRVHRLDGAQHAALDAFDAACS